jgi:microcystin-dependent protein
VGIGNGDQGVIENLTTGNFILKFLAAASGEVICVDQGSRQTIYNDGTNVRFVDMPRVGTMEFWTGLGAIPPWVSNCTVPPFLLCDNTVYNFSQYPYLGPKFGGNFGGNGVTTFGVPDLRGRFPLAYDGTGSRVTAAQCGINGQIMGAAADAQSVTLTTANMPSHYHAAGIYDPTHNHNYNYTQSGGNQGGGGAFGFNIISALTSASATGVRVNSSNGIDTTIWVVKT